MRPPEHLPDPVFVAPPPTRWKRRALWAGLALAALGVVGTVAWPSLTSGSAEDAASAVAASDAAASLAGAPSSSADSAGAPTVPAGNADTSNSSPSDAAIRVPGSTTSNPELVATSPDGDLAILVSLRFSEVPTGSSIPAEVHFVNHSTKQMHLPAMGEPHPTLALVLIDRDGREVRRVTEASVDTSGNMSGTANGDSNGTERAVAPTLPRRTRRLKPGATFTLPQQLIGAGDAPLPPGRYTLHAEFRADPIWKRLGLPTWTAPKGGLRSDLLTLIVSEK